MIDAGRENTAGLRKGRYPAKFTFEYSLLWLSLSQEMVPHSDSVGSAKRAWHPLQCGTRSSLLTASTSCFFGCMIHSMILEVSVGSVQLIVRWHDPGVSHLLWICCWTTGTWASWTGCFLRVGITELIGAQNAQHTFHFPTHFLLLS